MNIFTIIETFYKIAQNISSIPTLEQFREEYERASVLSDILQSGIVMKNTRSAKNVK